MASAFCDVQPEENTSIVTNDENQPQPADGTAMSDQQAVVPYDANQHAIAAIDEDELDAEDLAELDESDVSTVRSRPEVTPGPGEGTLTTS